MLTARDLLFLFLLPLLVAAIATACARRKPDSPTDRRPALFLTLALAAAPLLAGLCWYTNWYQKNAAFREPIDGLLLVPLVALVAALVIHYLPRGTTTIALLLAAIANNYLIVHLLPASPTLNFTLRLMAIAPPVLYALLYPIFRRREGHALIPILLGLSLATMATELAGTFIQFGTYTLVLPATLAGMFIASYFIKRMDLARAPLAAFLLIWTAILAFGHLWADIPWQRSCLLLAAPLTLWIAEIKPLRTLRLKRPWTGFFLSLVLAAIPAAWSALPAAYDLYKLIQEQINGGSTGPY